MPFDPQGQELRVEALEKIDRVIGLLAEHGNWCKRSFKTEDGRLCILGAVREADAELLLYAPILRAIRLVTGHDYRRIERFNDQWLTSHTLVIEVLERARHDLMVGLVPGAQADPPPTRGPVLRDCIRALRFW